MEGFSSALPLAAALTGLQTSTPFSLASRSASSSALDTRLFLGEGVVEPFLGEVLGLVKPLMAPLTPPLKPPVALFLRFWGVKMAGLTVLRGLGGVPTAATVLGLVGVPVAEPAAEPGAEPAAEPVLPPPEAASLRILR
jgi:hypothetical protein